MAKQATDSFSLGGSFRAQSSSRSNEDNQTEPIHDDLGDVSCETTANGDKQSESVSYKYCGSTLGTDLPKIGSVSGGLLIESISISTAQASAVTIEVSGHNHIAVPHTAEAEYTWPASIVASLDAITGKHGCADIFENATASIGLTSCNVTGSCQHQDSYDGSNDHLAGNNYEGKIEVSEEYVGGVITSITDIDVTWTIDDDGDSDSNTEEDASTLTAHVYLTRDP